MDVEKIKTLLFYLLEKKGDLFRKVDRNVKQQAALRESAVRKKQASNEAGAFSNLKRRKLLNRPIDEKVKRYFELVEQETKLKEDLQTRLSSEEYAAFEEELDRRNGEITLRSVKVEPEPLPATSYAQGLAANLAATRSSGHAAVLSEIQAGLRNAERSHTNISNPPKSITPVRIGGKSRRRSKPRGKKTRRRVG